MDTLSIRNLRLYYQPGEEESADLIADACEKTLDLIHDLWGLKAPDQCRVYVMTSWPRFLFHAAPWHWRIYLALTLPLRFSRIWKLWNIAGGWALRYGPRHAIGIKPARLLEEINPSLRNRVFIRRTAEDWVRHNTCHELVHASSDHLRLPTWLHEGLAMVTVDCLAGRPTVKPETLDTLEKQAGNVRLQKGTRGLTSSVDELIYMAVRGYWITRYLFETESALLREQLTHPQSRSALENELAAGLQIPQGEFMEQIDRRVISHFPAGSSR
jgi:hypothetical protein